MKIKDIPFPALRELALEEQERQGNKRNEDLHLFADKSERNFYWNKSKLGEIFWHCVSTGDYEEAREIFDWDKMYDATDKNKDVVQNNEQVLEKEVDKSDVYVKRFPSGAIRSDSRGKVRVDFVSPYAVKLLGEHHTKNSDNFNDEDEFGANYMKGIKPKDILPSLKRHFIDFEIAVLEGDKDKIKEELVALTSNGMMGLHQIVLEERGLYKEIYDKIEYVKK